MRIPGSEWAEGKLENKKLNKQKSLENENRKVVNTKTNPWNIVFHSIKYGL